MNKKLIPSLLLGGALLTGCNSEPATDAAPQTPAAAAPAPAAAPAVSKEDSVAIVNGTAISKANFKTLEDEIALRAHGQTFPKKQLLEELIQREILVQDAQKKGLDKSSDVKERLQMAERSLLSQADIEDYLKVNPVTDVDIKAEYDKEVAKMSGTEYKARHILVKTEDEAKKLIAELVKGAKFEELAKKHSLDPSKDQGGDLGWFTESVMVEPFSKAVVGLEKGKFTQVPVQTKFGWHIILREDSRVQTQTPPAFDMVKVQLRRALEEQKIQAMLKEMRKQANVEILMSLEEPKVEAPAAVSPDKAPAPGADAAKPAEPAKTEAATPTPTTGKPAEPVKAEAATPAPAEPAKTGTATPAAEPAKK